MPDSTPIVIPLENVNDPSVKLLAWLVNDGDRVREGQLIAEMETSKAVVELVAPAAGLIAFRAEPGDVLEVGSVIGHVGSGGPASSVSSSRATPQASAVPGVRFSRKALELIETHGLSPSAFASLAMVKEQDVLRFLPNAPAPAAVKKEPIHFALAGISLESVTLPAGIGPGSEGQLDPEFYAWLLKNPSFAARSSAEKCDEYQKNGASIGANVVLGPNSSVIAPRIVLRDGVEVGANATIQCREVFVAGALSSFREGLSVRGGAVIFGQNVYAGARIQIGGGGHSDPWSLLAVGDNAFLGDDLFLNICRPVVIGREVFLTQRAILVTHNIGHSILEGYENCFEPIVMEDGCQVGMGSTLYAGVRIGRAAIVASNSYVISNIPAGKLAIGVPAKVVRDSSRKLTRDEQVTIAGKMLQDFRELLCMKGRDVSEIIDGRFSLTVDGQSIDILLRDGDTAVPSRPSIVWTLETAVPPLPGCTIFHLLDKTVEGPSSIFADTAREFLRKRGIRFEPGPWRYRKGLI